MPSGVEIRQKRLLHSLPYDPGSSERVEIATRYSILHEVGERPAETGEPASWRRERDDSKDHLSRWLEGQLEAFFATLGVPPQGAVSEAAEVCTSLGPDDDAGGIEDQRTQSQAHIYAGTHVKWPVREAHLGACSSLNLASEEIVACPLKGFAAMPDDPLGAHMTVAGWQIASGRAYLRVGDVEHPFMVALCLADSSVLSDQSVRAMPSARSCWM